jgi:hypothetical protein
MIGKLMLGISALVLSFHSWSGEIIGNTYIGEKQGYIEIHSPEGKWEIEDREGRGHEIALFKFKELLSNSRPAIHFFGFPIAGDITLENMLREMRSNLGKQGMELGPIEPKRFAGKPVQTFPGRLLGKGVQSTMYLFQGAKSVFYVQCSAADVVFDTVKPMCDDIIEKLKY